MWFLKIEQWTCGHNTMRIYSLMARVVVVFGMHEVAGILNTRPLVKVPCVGPQIGVVHDATNIAFEMTVVNHIET